MIDHVAGVLLFSTLLRFFSNDTPKSTTTKTVYLHAVKPSPSAVPSDTLFAPFRQNIPPLNIQHPIGLILALKPKPHIPLRKRRRSSLPHALLSSSIFARRNDLGLVEGGRARVQREDLFALRQVPVIVIGRLDGDQMRDAGSVGDRWTGWIGVGVLDLVACFGRQMGLGLERKGENGGDVEYLPSLLAFANDFCDGAEDALTFLLRLVGVFCEYLGADG